MEKISIPCKTEKQLEQFFARKGKKLWGRWNSEVAWKMAEVVEQNVYMLLSKVVDENEKHVFYFYLKTEGTFWQTQCIMIHTHM